MNNTRKEIRALKLEPFKRKVSKLKNKVLGSIGGLFSKLNSNWMHFYAMNYRYYRKYLTWVYRIVFFILAVLVVMLIWKNDTQYIIYGGVLVLVTVIIVLLFRTYHAMFGKWIILKNEHELTEAFITKRLPRIITFYGPTGVGKDTTGAGVAFMLSRYFKQKLTREVNELEEQLFMFNLRHVNIHLDLRFLHYINPDTDKVEEYFQTIFLRENAHLVKDYYLDKMSLAEMWNDYQQFKSNRISYHSMMVYSNGLSNKHYIELLISYCKKYVRLSYFPNYILSNQPFKENNDLMAKMFSLDYTRTKSQDFKTKEENWEEKVFWPWVEKVIVTETEVGTWYNNLDPISTTDIKRGGMREFKAYNRHLLGEDYVHLQFDQTVNRTNKSIRELEHANSNIYQKNDIEGGGKRNFFINIWIRLKSLFKLNIRRVNKYNKKLEALQHSEIERFKRLYELTNNKAYEKKAKKWESKKYKNYSKRSEKYFFKKAKLQALIEKNKNDGYIFVSMNIAAGDAQATSVEPMSLHEIMQDDRPLFKRSYSVRLCFRMDDCYGRFDSHYLRTVAKERASNSEITFNEIPNWSKSMIMRQSDIVQLGYKTSYNLFGLTQYNVNRLKYNVTPLEVK